MTKEFKLFCDASLTSVGAVLCQPYDSGDRVVQYLSRQLTPGQKKWPIIQLELFAIVWATSKLRQYILGSKCTIYTDHCPLRHLFTAEQRNPRIQRWGIMLGEYGCDIKYQSGKMNIPADFLSRLHQYDQLDEDVQLIDNGGPSIAKGDNDLPDQDAELPDKVQYPVLQLSSETEIIKLQREDNPINEIITALEGDDPEDNPWIGEYVMSGGMLFRMTKPTKHHPDPYMQLVIPRSITRGVMEQLHDSEHGGGHVGIDKTYDKVRTRYYWNNMYRDVVRYVESCMLCRARKMKQNRAPMQEMVQAEFPFDILAVDICGKYPVTSLGYKYIVTFVDHFSGYPEVYATKDKTAETVAKLMLEEIIPRHSCCRQLLSDRGSEFINAVIALITERMNINHIKTSPYRPQTNGRAEVFHRFMGSVMAKYLERNGGDWDKTLPGMLMAYRMSTNDTTKFTPFFLMHLRDPILPLDTLLQPKLRYVGDEYVPHALQRLHSVFSQVKINHAAAREKNKRLYDRKAETLTFEPGDPVFYHDPAIRQGQPDKLQLKWKPYYRVIEKVGPVNYRIRHQLTNKCKLVHVNRLHAAHIEDNWDEDRRNYEPIVPDNRREEPARRQPLRAAKLAVKMTPEPQESSEEDEWDSEDDIPLRKLAGGMRIPQATDRNDEANGPSHEDEMQSRENKIYPNQGGQSREMARDGDIIPPTTSQTRECSPGIGQGLTKGVKRRAMSPPRESIQEEKRVKDEDRGLTKGVKRRAMSPPRESIQEDKRVKDDDLTPDGDHMDIGSVSGKAQWNLLGRIFRYVWGK